MTSQDEYYSRYSITHPAYAVVRIAGQAIEKYGAQYLGGRLLDIGCGEKVKQRLVGRYVDEYLGLDHPGTLHDVSAIDTFAVAYAIPFADNSFDAVLCTAVLEHLEEPSIAIREAFRVLKPGSHAIYTAPMFWHLHEEPRDFFRYTRYGLRHLFETAGFEITEIFPLSGFLTTFGTEFSYFLQRRRQRIAPMVDLSIVINNWLFPRLDRGWLRDEKFSWLHLVVVKKPDLPCIGK